MLQRILSVAAALAVVLFVGTAVRADKVADKDSGAKATSDSAVQGTVDKVGSDSLTITDKNGKDWTLTAEKDVDVTCDGKECKLSDLKKGEMVKVWTKKGDKTTAMKIEATSAAAKDKSEVKDK